MMKKIRKKKVQKELEEIKEYQKILDKKHDNIEGIVVNTEKKRNNCDLHVDNLFESYQKNKN